MTDDKSVDVGKVWWFWFTTSAFDVATLLNKYERSGHPHSNAAIKPVPWRKE